jgi:hypothetical protein
MMKMRKYLKVFSTDECFFPGDVPTTAPEPDGVEIIIKTHLGLPKQVYKEDNYCVVEIEYYYSKFDTARLLTIMDGNSLLLNGYEIRYLINGLSTVMKYEQSDKGEGVGGGGSSRKKRFRVFH